MTYVSIFILPIDPGKMVLKSFVLRTQSNLLLDVAAGRAHSHYFLIHLLPYTRDAQEPVGSVVSRFRNIKIILVTNTSKFRLLLYLSLG